SPKPAEFGSAGLNWNAIGWKIDVQFQELGNRIRPADHMGRLRSSLPEKYAPLRANGHGLQSVYLTSVSSGFATMLLSLIGPEVNELTNASRAAVRIERMTPG